jgi:hypothetical protein
MMLEYHTNIWDLLAYKIAKRLAEDKKIPMSIGLVREIADELRRFNETLVVKIYFKLPDITEMDAIQEDMLNMAMTGE